MTVSREDPVPAGRTTNEGFSSELMSSIIELAKVERDACWLLFDERTDPRSDSTDLFGESLA